MNTSPNTKHSSLIMGRVVLAALAGAMLLACSCAKTVPKTSVIFILIDTLRHDYLGSYGYSGPVSPHLDVFAGESHLFERAYAQSPWTKPSVASLLTGLYPSGHGLSNHEGRFWSGESQGQVKGLLAPSALTMAEVFREAGYATAAMVANPWITSDYGFDQGFDVFDDSVIGVEAPADSILLKARAWLNDRDENRPFFLYIHLMDVHGPYNAPEADFKALMQANRESGQGLGGIMTQEVYRAIPPYLKTPLWTRNQGAQFFSTWKHRYAAGVRYLDRRLGEFFTELEDRGTMDAAVVVVTSDHGEELHEHGGWDHGFTLFEDQIRVPMMIRPPEGVPGGRRHTPVVSLVDLLPTLCDMVEIARPEHVDGESLIPLWNGEETAGLSYATYTKTQPRAGSLMVGRYKVIQTAPGEAIRLYDLKEDPGEARDLSAIKPKLAEEMGGFLDQWLVSQSERTLFEASSEPVSKERREQLRSLGYVN